MDKFFPASARHVKAREFLELKQGSMTVLEYVACDAPKFGGPYTQIPCCDTPKSGGLADNSSTHRIFVVAFLYINISYKYTNSYNILQEFDVQLFYTFTCQNILNLYCRNIFLKNTSQDHNPAFFVFTALKERRLLVYLKGWSYDRVSKAK